MKKNVVIGLLGTDRDQRKREWRPTVALCQQKEFPVARFELLFQPKYQELANQVLADIETVSPNTQVQLTQIAFNAPWDFEEVYSKLYDFARNYQFDKDLEDYFVHITTGTHAAQISLFSLTASHYFPAKLIQTSQSKQPQGRFHIIDLDVSKYDLITERLRVEQQQWTSVLKGGIETRNQSFNDLIDRIERVAGKCKHPILLTGPTGAGKSRLAKFIFDLKEKKNQVRGKFVEVNCATLRGDGAMSALFGHVKGAFTGAISSRKGYLCAADKGLLFLDEIGCLGLDEQAMLLRAIEDKRFCPLGTESEVSSDFQLIVGTNSDLNLQVSEGAFREDLLARIDRWTFRLPGLKERLEDIEPNLDYELREFAQRENIKVVFNKDAREKFLKFAVSNDAKWSRNFRDLNNAIARMAALAPGDRITIQMVDQEIDRLRLSWDRLSTSNGGEGDLLVEYVSQAQLNNMDLHDQLQLAAVLRVCRESRNLSEAGRKLFNISRDQRQKGNDSDRLSKYLKRYNIDPKQIFDRR
jgi:transcriptional regulatory protein RtcR